MRTAGVFAVWPSFAQQANAWKNQPPRASPPAPVSPGTKWTGFFHGSWGARGWTPYHATVRPSVVVRCAKSAKSGG